MNRRQFLQTSLLSATSLAAATSIKAEQGFKLNYMLASAMYGELPLATIVPEVRKTGANTLDVWPRKHGNQREQMEEMGHEKFAALLQEHQVKLGCFTRYDLGPFKLDEELKVAQKFGASVIVTGGKGDYKKKGEDLKAEVAAFVEKMKPHAAAAAAVGVTIGIENHINNIIDTPDSLRWLADMTRDMPGIGIALAPYHLPQDTAVLAELIRHADKKLTLLYAWEHGMGCMKPMPKEEELQQMPGRGKLDFKPLLQALKDIRFTGPTEIFMHPTPRGIPILETAEQVTAEINRARAYLDGLIA